MPGREGDLELDVGVGGGVGAGLNAFMCCRRRWVTLAFMGRKKRWMRFTGELIKYRAVLIGSMEPATGGGSPLERACSDATLMA